MKGMVFKSILTTDEGSKGPYIGHI